ncbi:MAG: hypothetical protein RBS36_11590 [Thiomicrospira sp.]|jgi:hypothetical protein|nr:hypothetical protein [Thiomicrospira sp.]
MFNPHIKTPGLVLIIFLLSPSLLIAQEFTAQNPYKLEASIPPLKTISDDLDLFNAVITCYPAPPMFNMSVDFKIGSTLRNGSEYYDQTALQRNDYIGLVMTVPLYSTQERFRALHEESQRRELLATHIATMSKALAQREKARDMYAMYKAIEARSMQRLKEGFAPLTEHIGYIEKGAQYYEQFVTAEAVLASSVASITAYCTPTTQAQIRNRLMQYIDKGVKLAEPKGGKK